LPAEIRRELSTTAANSEIPLSAKTDVKHFSSVSKERRDIENKRESFPTQASAMKLLAQLGT
jgi:hypothetical protein